MVRCIDGRTQLNAVCAASFACIVAYAIHEPDDTGAKAVPFHDD